MWWAIRDAGDPSLPVESPSCSWLAAWKHVGWACWYPATANVHTTEWMLSPLCPKAQVVTSSSAPREDAIQVLSNPLWSPVAAPSKMFAPPCRARAKSGVNKPNLNPWMKRRTEGPLSSQSTQHEKDRLIAKPKDLEPPMANNPLEASVRSGAPQEGPRADTYKKPTNKTNKQTNQPTNRPENRTMHAHSDTQTQQHSLLVRILQLAGFAS